jgi:hypothetical protein
VIAVFRGSDYIEAQLITGLLRNAGIEVFLQGALLQGALGDLPATGHLSIFVAESDRTAAQRIIEEYERGELSIDEDSEPPAADTPN